MDQLNHYSVKSYYSIKSKKGTFLTVSLHLFVLKKHLKFINRKIIENTNNKLRYVCCQLI